MINVKTNITSYLAHLGRLPHHSAKLHTTSVVHALLPWMMIKPASQFKNCQTKKHLDIHLDIQQQKSFSKLIASFFILVGFAVWFFKISPTFNSNCALSISPLQGLTVLRLHDFSSMTTSRLSFFSPSLSFQILFCCFHTNLMNHGYLLHVASALLAPERQAETRLVLKSCYGNLWAPPPCFATRPQGIGNWGIINHHPKALGGSGIGGVPLDSHDASCYIPKSSPEIFVGSLESLALLPVAAAWMCTSAMLKKKQPVTQEKWDKRCPRGSKRFHSGSWLRRWYSWLRCWTYQKGNKKCCVCKTSIFSHGTSFSCRVTVVKRLFAFTQMISNREWHTHSLVHFCSSEMKHASSCSSCKRLIFCSSDLFLWCKSKNIQRPGQDSSTDLSSTNTVPTTHGSLFQT